MIYARQCSHCGEGLDAGYVINGGEEYYCSRDCLETTYSLSEIDDIFRQEDENGDPIDNDSYWTEWDVDDEEDTYDDEG